MHWTEEFFDEYYLQSTDPFTGEEQTRIEVDFLLENTDLKKDSPIMDLACGSGRHANELARRGFTNVTGLDLTLPYIELARKAAEDLPDQPNYIQENMKNFSADCTYQLVYSLFSSMFYFDDQHNLSILEAVYKALQRDGYFIIDYFNTFAFLKRNKTKDWYFTKNDVLVLEKNSYNPISGIITNERIIIPPQGQQIKRMFHLRDYSVPELRYHFERIGFEIINVFGHFSGEPFTLDSPRQIFVMRRPD